MVGLPKCNELPKTCLVNHANHAVLSCAYVGLSCVWLWLMKSGGRTAKHHDAPNAPPLFSMACGLKKLTFATFAIWSVSDILQNAKTNAEFALISTVLLDSFLRLVIQDLLILSTNFCPIWQRGLHFARFRLRLSWRAGPGVRVYILYDTFIGCWKHDINIRNIDIYTLYGFGPNDSLL